MTTLRPLRHHLSGTKRLIRTTRPHCPGAASELVFLGAVVEDRIPTPGVVALKGAFTGSVAGSVSIVVGRATYPDPPTNIKIDANVEEMARHYSRYREGKETLAAMAYYCLTVLEQASDAGRRPGRLGACLLNPGAMGFEA